MPVPLEARGLDLDAGDAAADRREDAFAEPFHRVEGIESGEFVRHVGRHGIESDADGGRRLLEAVPEPPTGFMGIESHAGSVRTPGAPASPPIGVSIVAMDDHPPLHLHLDRERGLDVEWPDGRKVHFPIAWLRRMSPSADARELRKELDSNPLAVLPASGGGGTLTATAIEPVGNYAIRIRFSDGHSSGIFSWRYLREIEPAIDGPAEDTP